MHALRIGALRHFFMAWQPNGSDALVFVSDTGKYVWQIPLTQISLHHASIGHVRFDFGQLSLEKLRVDLRNGY